MIFDVKFSMCVAISNRRCIGCIYLEQNYIFLVKERSIWRKIVVKNKLCTQKRDLLNASGLKTGVFKPIAVLSIFLILEKIYTPSV